MSEDNAKHGRVMDLKMAENLPVRPRPEDNAKYSREMALKMAENLPV